MVEVIKAQISIKTNKKHLRVWSVDNEGFLTGVIPGEYEDGEFRFTIGKEFAQIHYLVQEQGFAFHIQHGMQHKRQE